MEPLKRWDEKVKDLGTVDMGDLGVYRFQGSRCVRFDGKSLGIGYIGKTINDCKKFREEFVRVGCFCWSTKELCYGVPMCPIHPHGICGVDMEMRRADTVQDGDAMMVYTTIKHWGSKEPIAKIHPDCSIEYFGSWGLV
jgi:hypothetical protein